MLLRAREASFGVLVSLRTMTNDETGSWKTLIHPPRPSTEQGNHG